MSLSIFMLVAYLGLGAVAGIIGGLLGLGGGIVIVPALLLIFIHQDFPPGSLMHLAVTTSLATIIFTSMSSAYAHHRRQAVDWKIVKFLVPGIVMGAVIGAVIADHLDSDRLRVFFGIFELLVAFQVWSGLKPEASRQLPRYQGMLLAGNGIGMFSTILGIGGGTLTVPFLLWCNVNIRIAVATSAACGLPIALAGCITMIIAGWNQPGLPEFTLGYVFWPAALGIIITSILTAPVGAKFAHRLPVQTLKRIFAFVLAAIGIRMLI